MKTVYLIGGPMGVGKTTVCQILKNQQNNCVFLDGDWCWDMHPFIVNEQTKAMVMKNICFMLNQFIHCPVYETILFCWVMHEQGIIDEILSNLDVEGCRIRKKKAVKERHRCRDTYRRCNRKKSGEIEILWKAGYRKNRCF